MKTIVLTIITLFSIQGFAKEVVVKDQVQKSPKSKTPVSLQKKDKTKVRTVQLEPVSEIKSYVQLSLGVGSLSLKNGNIESDINTPVLGLTWKGTPVGSSDWDFGAKLEVASGSEGSKSLNLVGTMVEVGYRVYLGRRFSIAPHGLFGASYMDYKNKSPSMTSFDEVKGWVASYGWNIDAQFQVNNKLNLGLKFETTSHQINIGSQTNASQVTPSVLVQYSF